VAGQGDKRGWRFYFKIEGDEYVILSIIPLPK